MTPAFSARPFLLAIPLGLALWAAPVAVEAQTFDSTAGTAPSRKLSTPPNASPINQPGAMRRAYSHPASSPVQHKTARTSSSIPPSPPPH